MVYCGQDAFPTAIDDMRDGYMDGLGLNSPWALGDLTAKACLTHVCLSKPVPELLEPPMVAITPDTVNISPYGASMRWGDMLTQNPDPSTWQILDMEQYGMPTPSYK